MVDAAAGYELAFTEARRWLAEQADRLETLRSRIGTLFSAAAVVGGLLLNVTLSKDRPHAVTLLGQIGFACAALAIVVIASATVWIWLPKNLGTVLSPEVIIGGYVEAITPTETGRMYRNLALHLGDSAAANNRMLKCLQRVFSAASVAFVIGILGLGVALCDVLT
jgi:hypothetical protein